MLDGDETIPLDQHCLVAQNFLTSARSSLGAGKPTRSTFRDVEPEQPAARGRDEERAPADVAAPGHIDNSPETHGASGGTSSVDAKAGALAASSRPADPSSDPIGANDSPPAAPAASSVRPSTIEEYIGWAAKAISDQLDATTRRVYDTNVTTALTTAQGHAFFQALADYLEEVSRRYRAHTGTDLLLPGASLELYKKPFDSVIDKCFRKNVILNKEFPRPPAKSWITSANCTARLNDIVRGTLVCRYLDGPEFLAHELKACAEALGLSARYDSQQNERGYYAYHFYVKIPVEVLDIHWNATVVDVEIEVQLSTQLQEVLRTLTHKSYETLRLAEPTLDESWKWKYSEARFKASYLGHTLHLIEGLILELRRETASGKQKGDQ